VSVSEVPAVACFTLSRPTVVRISSQCCRIWRSLADSSECGKPIPIADLRLEVARQDRFCWTVKLEKMLVIWKCGPYQRATECGFFR